MFTLDQFCNRELIAAANDMCDWFEEWVNKKLQIASSNNDAIKMIEEMCDGGDPSFNFLLDNRFAKVKFSDGVQPLARGKFHEDYIAYIKAHTLEGSG